MLDERDAAHAHLLAAGGPMAALVAEHGPVDPYVWDGIPLEAGGRGECRRAHPPAQQISVVAALAIWGRFLTLLGGDVQRQAAEPVTGQRAAHRQQVRVGGVALVEHRRRPRSYAATGAPSSARTRLAARDSARSFSCATKRGSAFSPQSVVRYTRSAGTTSSTLWIRSTISSSVSM